MDAAAKIFYSSVFLLLLSSLAIVRHYSAPDVRWHVKLDTTFALVTSFSIVALVPFDVFTTLNDNSPHTIVILWSFTYWTTQALTWLILPIHQVYADAGDFTVLARLRRALRENLIFYVVLIALIVVLVILLFIFEGITLTSLLQSSIALSNAFGLATGIFLLGYGLVDIPRVLWKSANASRMLKECEERVGRKLEALQEAHADMCAMVLIVQATSSQMPRRHELRWAMELIDKESTEMVPLRMITNESADDMDYDIDYDELDGLASLRRSLKRSITVFVRAKRQYEAAVLEAFDYEDIVHNRSKVTGGGWRFRQLGTSPGSGCWSTTVEVWMYLYKCLVGPVGSRVGAVVCLIMSLAVVLAESTIWLPAYTNIKDERSDLSVFGQLLSTLRTDNADPVLVQLMVMLPLTYICTCTYYSLFKLGVFKYYTLTAHSSDAFSLLLSGALVCRYSAPLCYNFLTLIPVVHDGGRVTVFEASLGHNIIGIWAVFNRWFPVVLPVYCMFIALNLFHKVSGLCGCCAWWSWCCSWCCGSSKGSDFQFDAEMATVDTADRGREMIKRERANKQAGSAIGEGLGMEPSGSASAGLLANENPRETSPMNRFSLTNRNSSQSIADKYRKYGESRSASTRPLSTFNPPDPVEAGSRHSDRSRTPSSYPHQVYSTFSPPEPMEDPPRHNDSWEASKDRLASALSTTRETAKAKTGRSGALGNLFGGGRGSSSSSSSVGGGGLDSIFRNLGSHREGSE